MISSDTQQLDKQRWVMSNTDESVEKLSEKNSVVVLRQAQFGRATG
ncbi:hypothetical protein HNQ77_000949 [Silvibacterium bohemicum]|uniref:Uncharacterized protein n=1 Tax=Silvibacterium bohemicum TaxID=1577686 RepID=A0A841JRG5_9BACT|nr:hypothetical protein [Silvibacterium bohemicum]